MHKGRRVPGGLQLPTEDTSKGLAPVSEQRGMFIAYASAPGKTASDLGGRSGPYAAALAAAFGSGGLDHLHLFWSVKEKVLDATGGAQQPWESNGLARLVYLTKAAPAMAQVAPDSKARRDYELAVEIGTKAVWDAFLAVHPTGYYAGRARVQRAKLVGPLPATGQPKIGKKQRQKNSRTPIIFDAATRIREDLCRVTRNQNLSSIWTKGIFQQGLDYCGMLTRGK
jgi:hypothetical protein